VQNYKGQIDTKTLASPVHKFNTVASQIDATKGKGTPKTDSEPTPRQEPPPRNALVLWE